MDPATIAAQSGMAMYENYLKRQQQLQQGEANAAMMKYSPWTQLAGQSAAAAQKNAQYNTGVANLQSGAAIMGGARAQEQKNEQAKEENAKWQWYQKMIESGKMGA